MCLDIDINEDIIGENNEVFTLILTGAQTPDQATVTIIDNGEVLTSIFQHRLLVISLSPDPVQLRFNQPIYTVDEGSDLTVFVSANRPFVNGPFFVTVTSEDGSAQCM